MADMDYWFSDMHTGNVKISIRLSKQLFSGTSEFQRIDVFDSPEFGKFLTSDRKSLRARPETPVP